MKSPLFNLTGLLRSIYILLIGLSVTSSVLFGMEVDRTEGSKIFSAQMKQMSRELDELLNTVPFNGIVSIQGEDRKIIYEKSKGFTFLNDTKKTPINSDHEFALASSSKHMISVLALRLQENGILSLEAPIQKYIDISQIDMQGFTKEQKAIPGFIDEQKAKITLNTLLSLTSGLLEPKDVNPKPSYKFDAAATIAGDFIYGNQSYNLAVQVIEKVTGKNIAILLEKMFDTYELDHTWPMMDTSYSRMRLQHSNLVGGNIYLPTGSYSAYCGFCKCQSWFNQDDKDKKSFAKVYDRLKCDYSEVNNPLTYGPEYLYREGGLVVSNVNNMHKWNHLLYSNQIISANSLAYLLKKRAPYNIGTLGKEGIYGLGMGTIDGNVYAIGGWFYGFSNWISYFKNEKISLVILENVSRIDNLMPDQKVHMAMFSVIKKHIMKAKRNIRDLGYRY